MGEHYPLEYLIQKNLEAKVEKNKIQQSIQSRNNRLMDEGRTRHTPIVDMRSAYQSVVDKKHQPTQQEIHFRRFTSGSCVDGPKPVKESRTYQESNTVIDGERFTHSNDTDIPPKTVASKPNLRWGVKPRFGTT